MSDLPQHIAIIMDGNGRWAAARGLPRAEGHRRGVRAARGVVDAALDMGISYITLFGFSSENWSRPADEIRHLMNLLRMYLRSEMADLHKKGVCLRVIGDKGRLPDDIVRMIDHAESLTVDNTEIHVTIALSYGGRQEIAQAARHVAQAVKAGKLHPDAIDEGLFGSYLMTSGLPDPDLVIRTSGESRLSNFLLWQSAYSEMLFIDVLWPDFARSHLEEAIRVFQGRERRYGGLPADTPLR